MQPRRTGAVTLDLVLLLLGQLDLRLLEAQGEMCLGGFASLVLSAGVGALRLEMGQSSWGCAHHGAVTGGWQCCQSSPGAGMLCLADSPVTHPHLWHLGAQRSTKAGAVGRQRVAAHRVSMCTCVHVCGPRGWQASAVCWQQLAVPPPNGGQGDCQKSPNEME